MKQPTKRQLEIYELIHPDFKGKTVQEAANILGITARAAYRRLDRLRKNHPNAFRFEEFTESAELYSNDIEYIYRGYQAKAATKQLKFDISLDDFMTIVQLECSVCHKLPKQANKYNPKRAYYSKTGYKFDYNHLWRFDVTKGYTYINSVPICSRCIRRRRDNARRGI